MSQYPNYRVSIEIILRNADRVLITKRADDCDVNPGGWSVPAGKVKYEEVPMVAALRELKEESGIDGHVLKELSCRAGTILSKGEKAYRLFFTYLVEANNKAEPPQVRLSEEHSDFVWVTAQDLDNPKFAGMRPDLKEMIVSVLA